MDEQNEHLFRESLKCVRVWNKIFVNSEEYSVFHSRLHKLVLDGDYSKAAAAGKSLALLSNEEQVIIYARPGASRDILSSELNKYITWRIMYAPGPVMRGEDDPLIKFKSGEARILVTSIPLVSGYAESGFDESKVNLVIFMIFLWPGKAWLTMSTATVWPQGRALTVSQAEVNCWNDTYSDEKERIYEENGQSQESRHSIC